MNWINRYLLIASIAVLLILNEFTLVFFDPTPPLSERALFLIRSFNIVVLLIALNGFSYLKPVSRWIINYIAPSLIAVIFLDIGLSILGFGYPRHYEQENIERYPSPMDGFSGKPDVKDHNNLGFRGEFASTENSYNIAIFGGSTAYNGTPPIIEIVQELVIKSGINAEVFNFGSVSSNHTQHIHRLLKFIDDFNFDLVIFYGGGNETLQYSVYDPRPGFPYNFFFRNELNPLIQSLLRYSSIFGALDLFSNGMVSGLRALNIKTKDSSWAQKVVNKYWHDLSVANRLTTKLVTTNTCDKASFLSITQPGNPHSEEQTHLWNLLKQSMNEFDASWLHLNLTSLSTEVEFTDIIHLTQSSREFVAKKIASEVITIYKEKCRIDQHEKFQLN